jgi:hypothetical protein
MPCGLQVLHLKLEPKLFWTDKPENDAPGIMARLYNTKSGTKRLL